VVWTEADIPDQSGRLALVTGANSGLGLETARALAARGARVLLACRDPERGEQARQALAPIASAGIEVLAMDLADLASVARAAEQVATSHGQLDLLINNAGVMAPPRQLSRQGYELQFAVNHLGHFALTQALLPLLKARAGARVVHVSSGAHYFGRIAFDDLQGERRYDAWAAYAQSKLANVMTALELQQQLEASDSAVLSVAAHPGLARTNLQPTSVAARGSRMEGLAASGVRGGEFFGPGGLANLKGYPARCRLAASTRNAAQRQRLWLLSQELSERLGR
jgi:protochlorophyllide reductase